MKHYREDNERLKEINSELLEALKDCVNAIENADFSYESQYAAIYSITVKAKAAIKKATL